MSFLEEIQIDVLEKIQGDHVDIWIEDEIDEINSLTLALTLKERQFKNLEFLAHLDHYGDECVEKTEDGRERIDAIEDCLKKYNIVMGRYGEIKYVPLDLVVVDIGDAWEHHTLIFRKKSLI